MQTASIVSQDNPQPAQTSGIDPRRSSKSILFFADWYALRLLNHFRLFLLTMFTVTFYLAEGFEVLGSRDPSVYKYTLLLWSVLAAGFYTAIRMQRPSLEVQLNLHVYIDIACIVALMYASGGIQSYIGALLILHIALIANFMRPRYVLLFAAIATAFLFAEELLASFIVGKSAAHLTETAMLGITLFGVAIITSLLLSRRPEHSGATRIQRLSDDQLKLLRERIIEEIDSGVLYLDEFNHVQLINSQAEALLINHRLQLPAHISMLSEPIWQSLQQWRKSPQEAVSAIDHPTLPTELLPHYIPIDEKNLLIRLDDNSEITQRLHQLKQASLGRMSSSIAHEIRNPLGAISHAVQLLEESENLHPADQELLLIAEKHTRRINRIVEDVMQLSGNTRVNAEDIPVQEFLASFKTRFESQSDTLPEKLSINCSLQLQAHFDPHHLDQIIWNLCCNATAHNAERTLVIDIHAYNDEEGLAVIDVCDNGRGVPKEQQTMIFDPFYTTESGTGLGLHICRELCVQNNAAIAYIDISNGACFRITMPASAAGEASSEPGHNRAA